jgi:hypothetical protein
MRPLTEFLKKDYFSWGIGGLILVVHFFLYLGGVDLIRIDYYWQFMDPALLEKDFWGSLWFFHANPPGLSLVHYLADTISFGNSNAFWALLLPIFHLLAFRFFYAFCKGYGFPYSKWVTAVLFLNPLLFIYFKYPFYSTFLFLSSCILLYTIFSKSKQGKALLIIAALLAFNMLMRSSWHIVIVLIFLIPFFKGVRFPSRILALFIIVIPLFFYVKNYLLFGKFSTSTWMGMNLYHHIDQKENDKGISSIGRFEAVEAYAEYYDPNHPLINKYEGNPHLNSPNFNNIRYILISDAFLDELTSNFSISHSLPTLADGYCRLMESPARYDFLYKDSEIPEDLPFWCYDWFDLPNPQHASPHFRKGFSWYLIVYSLSILGLFIFWKKLTFRERWVFLLTLTISGIYFSVDYAEANRMRVEIEPFWYALQLIFWSKVSQALKKAPQQGS